MCQDSWPPFDTHTHTHFITVTDLRMKKTIQVHFRFRRMLINIYNTNNPSAGITEFVSPSMQKQNPHITGETSPHFVLLEQQLLKPINLLFFFFGVIHSQLRWQEICQRLPAHCQSCGGNTSALRGAHYQK